MYWSRRKLKKRQNPESLFRTSAKEKPQEAVVVAVGPGKYSDGKLEPVSVKEGDMVIYSKYAGTQIKYGDKEYTIVSESDIIAKIE